MYATGDCSHYEIAELLLKCGANPNIPIEDGAKALILAYVNDKYDIVNLLLEEKANPNIQVVNG